MLAVAKIAPSLRSVVFISLRSSCGVLGLRASLAFILDGRFAPSAFMPPAVSGACGASLQIAAPQRVCHKKFLLVAIAYAGSVKHSLLLVPFSSLLSPRRFQVRAFGLRSSV